MAGNSAELSALARIDVMEKQNVERFARLEALVLAKSFGTPTVPVSGSLAVSSAPVSQKPFFMPSGAPNQPLDTSVDITTSTSASGASYMEPQPAPAGQHLAKSVAGLQPAHGSSQPVSGVAGPPANLQPAQASGRPAGGVTDLSGVFKPAPVGNSSLFDNTSAHSVINQPASVGVGQVFGSVPVDKSADFYQLPGESTLITSEALPFIPSHLAAQAVPVSIFWWCLSYFSSFPSLGRCKVLSNRCPQA